MFHLRYGDDDDGDDDDDIHVLLHVNDARRVHDVKIQQVMGHVLLRNVLSLVLICLNCSY